MMNHACIILHRFQRASKQSVNQRIILSYQIKSILQRVQIVHHQSGGTTATGQGGEHVRIGGGSGDSSLLGDTFHGPDGIIGQYDCEGFNERLEETNNDLELGQSNVVVVEGCQE